MIHKVLTLNQIARLQLRCLRALQKEAVHQPTLIWSTVGIVYEAKDQHHYKLGYTILRKLKNVQVQNYPSLGGPKCIMVIPVPPVPQRTKAKKKVR